MTNENDNLEKNISRLVKQSDDSGQPGKNFTDNLINSAIDELTQKTGTPSRERKSTIMTAKKIFAYAASILVVCGVLIAVMMPKREIGGGQANNTLKKEMKTQSLLKTISEPESAKIEYTASASKPQPPAAVSAPAPIAAPQQPVDSLKNSLDGNSKETGSIGSSTQAQPEMMYQMMMAMTGGSKEKPVGDKSSRTAGNYGYGILDQSTYFRQISPACQTPMAHGGSVPPNGEDVDAQFFKNYGVNPFVDTEDDHLSTFAMDVDTASYTIVRGYLHEGHMPPDDAVRVEEFVNYFKYDYPAPKKDDFALYCEASPWQFGSDRKNSYLLRLALKARQISDENRKPAILTFVIDVSGSMQREDRLELVKKSLRLLIDNLKPDDKIGIAVYETRGRKLMDYKGLDEKTEILSAIEMLAPAGSTNAEEGIRIGYEMADKAFKTGYINRVILCTDGVANEGQTAAEDILKEIKEKADKGITLSAIGFGMGNYNDVLLEKLGDNGNGHYAYVDTITEARRIFVENLTGTLQLVARDAKIQVDFNPDIVRSYRLIGYENRDVPDEKFRDDKQNGGQVGAGHSVTALYELKLWPEKKGTIATTYVRYKKAGTGVVTEFKSDFDTGKINRSFDSSSRQFRLAATAAEFAEILRHSYWAKGATLAPVLQQAQQLSQEFQKNSDVIELADLISKADQLTPKPPAEPPQEE